MVRVSSVWEGKGGQKEGPGLARQSGCAGGSLSAAGPALGRPRPFRAGPVHLVLLGSAPLHPSLSRARVRACARPARCHRPPPCPIAGETQSHAGIRTGSHPSSVGAAPAYAPGGGVPLVPRPPRDRLALALECVFAHHVAASASGLRFRCTPLHPGWSLCASFPSALSWSWAKMGRREGPLEAGFLLALRGCAGFRAQLWFCSCPGYA